jgi:hypothetical protein
MVLVRGFEKLTESSEASSCILLFVPNRLSPINWLKNEVYVSKIWQFDSYHREDIPRVRYKDLSGDDV